MGFPKLAFDCMLCFSPPQLAFPVLAVYEMRGSFACGGFRGGFFPASGPEDLKGRQMKNIQIGQDLQQLLLLEACVRFGTHHTPLLR